MSEDPFEEELRPSSRRPISWAHAGKGSPRTRRNIAPSANGRLTITAVRLSVAAEQAPIGLGLREGVIHLDEIDVARPDDFFQVGVRPRHDMVTPR